MNLWEQIAQNPLPAFIAAFGFITSMSIAIFGGALRELGDRTIDASRERRKARQARRNRREYVRQAEVQRAAGVVRVKQEDAREAESPGTTTFLLMYSKPHYENRRAYYIVRQGDGIAYDLTIVAHFVDDSTPQTFMFDRLKPVDPNTPIWDRPRVVDLPRTPGLDHVRIRWMNARREPGVVVLHSLDAIQDGFGNSA